MTSWCCQLCAVSWVQAKRRTDEERTPAQPSFINREDFQLVCEQPDARGGPPPKLPRDGWRVAHGLLWHMMLAQHLQVSLVEVEGWCAAPRSMGQARSRSVSDLTGLPLALLRP